MKTQFKNIISKLILPLMMLSLVFGFGCNTSKPTPDPLAGFHAASKKLDQLIIDDYEGYIQNNLSSKEKQNLGP